ncbi:MAG: hypothetical protein RMI04_08955 [Thermofilaceae archaeon]|nr:hypothetical protein [Thermofilaceae archaeon]
MLCAEMLGSFAGSVTLFQFFPSCISPRLSLLQVREVTFQFFPSCISPGL